MAKPDSAGIGSPDLWRTIDNLDEAHDYERAKLRMETGGNIQPAIQHMHKTADRRLIQLLLARFLLLNFFIREARSAPGGFQEKEHRRLWVLLQVQPQIFRMHFDVDIFTDLAQLLHHTSIRDLKDRVVEQYMEVLPVLSKVRNPSTNREEMPPLYLVVDEAQLTTSLRQGEFMSNNLNASQSMLREIWLSYTGVLEYYQMRLVLSGTGIDLTAMQDELATQALKSERYDLKFDIGAFEDSHSQTAYIKRYIPGHWTEPCWRDFLIRAWGWLQGR